jgi:tRNA G18 (ribose-2'-O)-methylase SpoU
MNRKSTMDELNRLSIDEFKQAEKAPIILVLDNIRSLLNIGSIFRTADAFRVAHIHLSGITAQPPHRDIQKTALGATETVSWSHISDTIECCQSLKKDGYQLLALEQTTESIDITDWSAAEDEKVALVIGNEVDGVQEEVIQICDKSLEIAQYGSKHSLNVAVSTGIAIHAIYQLLKV